MQNHSMIDVLLKDPLFLTIGALACIIISLSIFKKLFKVVLYTLLIFFCVSIYIIKTGTDPQEILKESNKTLKIIKNNLKEIKNISSNSIKKIEKEIPNKTKKSVKRILPKSKKEFNKIAAEQLKAMKKLKDELEKNKEALNQ